MKTTNDKTKEMKSLCKCLFSVPANVSYRVSKILVGSYIDPLTTSKPEEEEDIACSNITQISKTLSKKRKLFFLQYSHQYTGGGIVTSDQSPKSQKSPPIKNQC